MRKDWEVKKLGDVCEIERGGSPRPISEYITNDINGINWIKIGDASDNSKYISSTKEKIKPEGVKKSRMVYKGDFILSNSMSFGKPYILDIDGCIHDGWLVIRDINNLFDKSFLYYYLSSPQTYQEFKRMAVGGVVNNLNSNLVRSVCVPVPPLQTQQQIVEELNCLTSIIEKQKKQLEELDNLAESIFYDMFGNPIVNEKGWNVKKLEDIVHKNCTLSYGIVQPMEDVVDGVPIVRPIDLIDTFVSDTNLKRTRKEISNKYKRTILTGYEILLCVRGTTGIVSLVNELFAGYNVTRGIVPILLSSLYNRWFVYYQIKTSSIQQKISELTYGIALRQINIKDLRALTLITPPLSLQQQFASKIEAIEKQKELIKKSIKETEDLFNSRMDYYFN
ncbi:MAG TPA: restriction endonuclease subunit S [Bacteroidaceae bacterium]|nr:restriction endonuclease subunit S [Bacteroidaceae bacterium]